MTTVNVIATFFLLLPPKSPKWGTLFSPRYFLAPRLGGWGVKNRG